MGINRTRESKTFTRLPFQKIHLIDIGRNLASEHDDNDGESYRGFPGCNRNNEQRDDLAGHRFKVMREMPPD